MLGAILAGVGALIGWGSSESGRSTALAQIKLQKKLLAEQEQRTLATLDLQYETAKETADKNANAADRKSTLQEALVSDDTNNTIGSIAQSQKAQGLQENTSAISTGMSVGSQLSEQAASGTRAGSSVAQSTSLQKALADAQLQMQENTSRSASGYSLASALSQFAENKGSIQENRTSAYDLRQSYEEGGSQYKLYQNSRSNTQADYEASVKQLNSQKSSYEGLNRVFNNLTGIFSGASSGLSLGSSLSQLAADATSPDYSKQLTLQTLNFSNNYNSFDNLNSIFGTKKSSYSFGIG